jgi:hypothetical protein
MKASFFIKISLFILLFNQAAIAQKDSTTTQTANKINENADLTRKEKTLEKYERKAEFESFVLNTDFIIPMVKFNVLKEPDQGQVGTVSLFNSVGAGLSLSYGRLTVKYKDDNWTVIDREDPYDFKNYISLQAGILFSTSTDQEVRTSFAPVITLVALDLSVGWGYEFGYRGTDYNGRFWVISYNIPLRKLYSKGMLALGKLPEGISRTQTAK